nr:VapE domain-containing protein [uncultured Rhodoferax sp.]
MESPEKSPEHRVLPFTKDLSHQDLPGGAAPPGAFKQLPTSIAAVWERPAHSQTRTASALDAAKAIGPEEFPQQPRTPSSQMLPTIANFQYLLDSYNIEIQYNVIKKKLEISIAGHTGSFDNHDNVLLTQIGSIAALNGFPTSKISDLMVAVADRKQFNPVSGWINSEPWDGTDRLPAFYATLVQSADFPQALKETLMYRWTLSAVAAALKTNGFHARGVLTLQGSQGLGKTAWAASLVSDDELRAQVVLLNHHLDGSNKDSITRAASHWLVEIGELDSSFKKDVARLKGFITADVDKVRRPYGRLDSEYPRRTVFCATVNDTNFLVDSTGNSRWWTIPVERIDFKHGINMQQLYAQLAIDFEKGAQWWLTPEEELILEQHNNAHRVISAVRERILNAVDIAETSRVGLPPMTAIEVLQAIGINFPTNPQCKECAGILRELFGESKKIHGKVCWRVPLRHRQAPSAPSARAPDQYRHPPAPPVLPEDDDHLY